MTVYVAHEVKDDIRAAERFGELRYVNKFYVHGDELEQVRLDVPGANDGVSVKYEDVNVIPRGYTMNMERCVVKFQPGRDYLLIAGDHLQLLALTALLINKAGFLDVLRWDRQLRDYIPVRLSSGLVPPRAYVLPSGTDIGENEHGESRSQNYDEYEKRETRRLAQQLKDGLNLALDGPHRPRRKPPAEDDH